MSLENQSRQSAQLPGTIVNRDVFRVPCNLCPTLKLGNSLVALVTADGIDTVCELPVYRFHRFNAQISVSSKEIEIGSLALNVQITYLRRALNLDEKVSIEAVIKKGYILRTC